MLKENITLVKENILKACLATSRDPKKIILMGASKSQTIEDIEKAYDYGLRHFGENYLQEAESKINQIDKDIVWHFIGSIQTRKTKKRW